MPNAAARCVDLNADLGEGFGVWPASADRELLSLVTSASIACGFHAGDPVLMRETVAEAVRQGVVIGAHPGYPDLQGFGRRDLAATPREVTAYVIYQVGALAACAAAAGSRVRYVKPHGALYNRAARDVEIARAIAEAVRLVDRSLALLGLAGSRLISAAKEAGLEAVPEAFIDRGYLPDGSLAPRGAPNALIEDPAMAAARAVELVHEQQVHALDGSVVPVIARSLGVHGDGRNTLTLLRAARERLRAEGVGLAPFSP